MKVSTTVTIPSHCLPLLLHWVLGPGHRVPRGWHGIHSVHGCEGSAPSRPGAPWTPRSRSSKALTRPTTTPHTGIEPELGTSPSSVSKTHILLACLFFSHDLFYILWIFWILLPPALLVVHEFDNIRQSDGMMERFDEFFELQKFFLFSPSRSRHTWQVTTFCLLFCYLIE